MKILMISHEYPPVGGGGANACMNLAAEYGRMEHIVQVLTVWYPGLLEEEEFVNVKVTRLKSKRKHLEYCSFTEMLAFLWKVLRCADRMMKEKKFDVCQVFFAIPSGPIGYYLKKRYGLPYIIRFGGGDIPGFQERFRFIYKIIGPFEKIIWGNADALVANSQGLKDLANGFYNKKEIRVITNGVNIDAFFRINEKRMDDDFRILFVSRLIERKGLQYIIPQMAEIRKKCGRPVSLIIVGDGPYRGELERIAKESGEEGSICFEGQKTKRELPHYYENADVFILPSKREGMPNVVLEAMASGLPVVMTPCEGSKELIKENGFVVPVEQFTETLALLCNDSVSRLKMGRKSRELINTCFLWSTTAKEYENLMKRVLNEE